MSPTMTEGGIASWKKSEGDNFAAGDVLLEIVCHQRRLGIGT
jgi:pyruvate/2-oxoglutarate dehydrogenase complex dihydrolipoamide acyltransferase (E2) component